jgi:hypothetical protein
MTGVAISLRTGCDFASCGEFAFPLHRQLERGYETCSVMPVPQSVAEWREESKTRRTRTNRAERLGYQARAIKREEYAEDIFEINTSKEVRQGRPMTAAYRERQNFLPLPEYPCPFHGIETYGVVDAHGTLAAYLWLYRVGDLALVSSILGHAEHEPNDVMYLLFQAAVADQCLLGGYFVYNRHDSGLEGLRYFKSKLGFEPTEVEWRL